MMQAAPAALNASVCPRLNKYTPACGIGRVHCMEARRTAAIVGLCRRVATSPNPAYSPLNLFNFKLPSQDPEPPQCPLLPSTPPPGPPRTATLGSFSRHRSPLVVERAAPISCVMNTACPTSWNLSVLDALFRSLAVVLGRPAPPPLDQAAAADGDGDAMMTQTPRVTALPGRPTRSLGPSRASSLPAASSGC